MRLTPDEVAAIKTAAAGAFGATAVVRLFGSRVDDSLRGGDIDLLIETDPPIDQREAKGRFEDELFRRIEPRKVDIIVHERGTEPRGFQRIGYRDGIVL